MKIILTITCIKKMGGTEKATIDLANLLAQDDENQIIILSYYKKLSSKYESMDYSLNRKIKIIYFDKKTVYLDKDFRLYKLQQILNGNKFSRFIKKYEPTSVIHSQIENVTKLKNIRNNLIIHTSYKAIQNSNIAKYLLKGKKRIIDNIIVLSKEDVIDINKELKSEKGIYIPNTLSMDVKQRTNLNNKKMLYLGRLNNEVKQIDHIIKAFNILKKNGELNDWKLDIYGEGEDYFYLENLIKEYKLEKEISLCGKTKDLDNVFINSDLIILSSKYEGLPMSLLEAASSGLALISYNCSNSINEIICDNGFVIEQNNINELALGIKKIISDSSLLEIMGRNSIKIINKNFNKEDILRKWYGILE